jgi:hypothetical protein
MQIVTVQSWLPAGPDLVWEALSDVESWPGWIPTVMSLQPEELRGSPGVGAAYLLKQPRLPTARWVVTEWRRGESFTWQSASPGVRTIGTHRVAPGPGSGTQVELSIGWVGPMARLARLVYGRLARRYIEVEAEALAERTRTGGAEGP